MKGFRKALAFAVILAGATGCDDITPIESVARLEQIDGDDQVTLPGGRVPRPLVVRAVDESGQPRAGVVVSWTGSQGSAFAASSDTTDEDGHAVGVWLVGSDASYTATASSDDMGEVTFEAFTDPDALTVSAFPDTIRFDALGDTASLFIRVQSADGSLDTLVAPDGWGSGPPVIAEPVFTGPFRMTLRAGMNGIAEQSIRFGTDHHVGITVIVEQVAVGARIFPFASEFAARDTIRIGPDSTVSLVLLDVDGNGNVMEGATAKADVTWESSDPAVASMAGSAAQAAGDGVTTITASQGDPVAEVALRVWTLSLASLGAGGATTCGLTGQGQLVCWGFRDVGAHSALDVDHFPVERAPGPYTSLSMGGEAACALTVAGAAMCWGRALDGDRGFFPRVSLASSPVHIGGDLTFTAIDVGGSVACGLTTTFDVYCWGSGYAGALGNGSNLDQEQPVKVHGGRLWKQVTAGGGRACAIDVDDRGWCWGHNSYGGLGSPRERCVAFPGEDTTTSFPVYCSTTPVEVSGSHRFKQLSAGNGATCGITTAQKLYCWGSNLNGVLGTFDASLELQAAHPDPLPVAPDKSFQQVVMSDAHACAIDIAGAAWCWGHGFIGQLGLGGPPADQCQNGTCAREPAPVAGGLTFKSIAPAGPHTCGLTTDDVAYCWGWGESGALGTGALTDRWAPARVVFQPQ